MKLALFDFDGTITTHDTYTKFIFLNTSKARLCFGALVLAPLILLNKMNLFPSPRLRPLVSRFAFIGVKKVAINSKAKTFVEDYLPTILRREMLEAIQQHKENGDRVIVVSASISPYLELWCENLGLELICSELESKNGYFTGAYTHGDCSGKAKAIGIKNKVELSNFSEIIAYGDTEEDYPMFELANTCFYRGKPFLSNDC